MKTISNLENILKCRVQSPLLLDTKTFLKMGIETNIQLISKGLNEVRVIEVGLFSDFTRPIPRTVAVNATVVICLLIIF